MDRLSTMLPVTTGDIHPQVFTAVIKILTKCRFAGEERRA
jgi:hypothetical protein